MGQRDIGTPEHWDTRTRTHGHWDTGTLVQRNNGTIGQDNRWGESAGAHLQQLCCDISILVL